MDLDGYDEKSFAIQKDGERYLWIAFFIFILLSSLIGDSLILFASFQKEAFKLNSFIIVVIQYIAVCDIASAIFSVIPRTLSLIANSRVFSDDLCSIQENLNTSVAITVAWLTPILTTSKYLLIKYPLRPWSKSKKAHIVCWLSIIPAVLVTITKLIVNDASSFEYRHYACSYTYTAKIWKSLVPILAFIVLILPNSILIATTIPTLKYLYEASKSSRRVQGSIPWQGAVTVTLTAAVHCISYLPISIYYVGTIFIETTFFEVHFYRVADFLTEISIMSNIYIYTLTIKSFRRFVYSRILALNFSTISRSTEGGPTTGTSLILV